MPRSAYVTSARTARIILSLVSPVRYDYRTSSIVIVNSDEAPLRVPTFAFKYYRQSDSGVSSFENSNFQNYGATRGPAVRKIDFRDIVRKDPA